MEDPDKELVAAAAAHDQLACTHVIRKAERLTRAALHGRWFAVDSDQADVIQLVRIQVLRSLAKWRPERGRFSTWVYGIVRNVYNSYYRSSRSEPRSVPLDDAPQLAAAVPGEGAQELQKASTARLLVAFRRVYAGLSAEDKAVVDHMTYHGDGIDGHSRLASRLSITDAAAKQRVFRRKSRLRRAIETDLQLESDWAANK